MTNFPPIFRCIVEAVVSEQAGVEATDHHGYETSLLPLSSILLDHFCGQRHELLGEAEKTPMKPWTGAAFPPCHECGGSYGQKLEFPGNGRFGGGWQSVLVAMAVVPTASLILA